MCWKLGTRCAMSLTLSAQVAFEWVRDTLAFCKQSRVVGALVASGLMTAFFGGGIETAHIIRKGQFD